MRRPSIRFIGVKGGLNLSTQDTPERVVRSLGKTATVQSFRMTEYNKYGSLSVKLKVDKYTVWIEYMNFRSLFEYELKKSGSIELSIHKCMKILKASATIRTGCTCPDFNYRFKYLASIKKYLAHALGSYEKRPSKITNPNLIGFTCKHNIAALKSSRSVLNVIEKYLINKFRIIYVLDEGDDDE